MNFIMIQTEIKAKIEIDIIFEKIANIMKHDTNV